MASDVKGKLVVPVWVEDGIVKPLVTDAGNVDVNLAAQDVNIDVNLAAQDIDIDVVVSGTSTPFAKLMTVYGGAWRNQEKIFGYYDQHTETHTNAAMPAGTSNIDGNTVPAGQLWHIKGVSTLTNSATVTVIRVTPNIGGYFDIHDFTAIPVNIWLDCQVDLVLEPGQYMRMRYYTMTAGDLATWRAWGYIMSYA